MFASDYRRMAREALRGKWKKISALFFISSLLFGGLLLDEFAENFFGRTETFTCTLEGLTYAFPYVQLFGFGYVLMILSNVISLLMMPMLTAGEYALGQDALNGVALTPRRLFPLKQIWKLLGMFLLRALLVFLWTFVFIVPGFVALYRYSMADYLMINHPEMGPVQALRRSRELMMGNKGRAFALDVSFIGWLLLLNAVSYGLGWVFNKTGIDALPLYFVFGALLGYAISAPLSAYRVTAKAAFFADVEQADSTAEADADEQAQQARRAAEEAARKRDEDVRRAHDMFLMYHCSRRMIDKAGLTEQYTQLLSGNGYLEDQWKRDYVNALMQRFDGDPSALDDIIALAGEYGMDDLADRALGRVERHIYQQTLPDPEILNLLGRMLTLLQAECFKEQTGFVTRKKQQILSMVCRLEQRLTASDPDGEWTDTLRVVRQMAEGA